MAVLISNRSESKYLSFENQAVSESNLPNSESFRPVNIYRIDSNEKKFNLFDCLRICCCCCGKIAADDYDGQIENSTWALVGPTGTSYGVNNGLVQPTQNQYDKLNCDTMHRNEESSGREIPTIIEEEHHLPKAINIDEEYMVIKNVTEILLASEKMDSSANLSLPPIVKLKKKKYSISTTTQSESGNSSQCSTLKSGESESFIKEVVTCRDTFLNALEWCDNSLTRGKKCRLVKSDDWLDLKVLHYDGTDKLDFIEFVELHFY